MSTAKKHRSGAAGARNESGVRAKYTLTRVLVVDDVPDNRDLYAEYLRHKGFEVVTAADGQEALDLATAQSFDVVVMDLALPVVDGWEATRRLKADARTRAIPVIALTAHVEPTLGQRAVDAGCDRYLTKPHLPADLYEEIRRVLDHARSARSVASSAGK